MMKHTLLYIAVSGMTLLTSCQLGKHYTRPDLHLPQQLDTLRQQDTLSIADMQWWEIYTDTTLQSLIEKTLDNNKDMKIAAARVKELAAMKRIDFANLFPQLNGGAYAQKEGSNMAWRGGSSSVFRKALKAEADSICTSSMIYTLYLPI